MQIKPQCNFFYFSSRNFINIITCIFICMSLYFSKEFLKESEAAQFFHYQTEKDLSACGEKAAEAPAAPAPAAVEATAAVSAPAEAAPAAAEAASAPAEAAPVAK